MVYNRTVKIKMLTAVGLAVVVSAAASAEWARPDLVVKVVSGEIKEARASWWGFDKDDSTVYLQAAINSGVPKLIVEKMPSPWVVTPISVLYGSTGEKMGLTLTKDLVTHVKDHLHYKTDPRSTNMPLTPKDIDLLPTLWRNPDRIEDGHGSGLVFELDTADGGTLVMPVLRKGNTLVTGTLYKRKR